jgi:hypothetical protein
MGRGDIVVVAAVASNVANYVFAGNNYYLK